jgi:protein transport protein SEC13
MVHRETAPGQWTRLYSYEGHASSVNALAWAPLEYGLQLACASSDGKVSVLTHRDDDSWGVETITDCAMGVNAVAWAPSHHLGGGKGDAGSEGANAVPGVPQGSTVKRIATAGCDNVVRVYRQVAGGAWDREAELRAHGDWVRDVAWAPCSGLGGNTLASCADDGTVVMWRQAQAGGAWTADQLPVFPAPVWRLSWSATGNLLAVSCGDNSVTLWKENLAGQWQQVSSVPDPTLVAMGKQ